MAKISSLVALSFVLVATAPLRAVGSIPVRWTVDTFRVKPLVYECYHGETLDLAAEMTAYGEPLDLSGCTAQLYWTTNANATTYWVTNATIASSASVTNIVSAIFSGSFDPGAPTVYGFIAAEDNVATAPPRAVDVSTAGGRNYRASFQLNFRPSPGFSPSVLPIPHDTLDFDHYNVLNAPYYTRAEGDARYEFKGGGTSLDEGVLTNKTIASFGPSAANSIVGNLRNTAVTLNVSNGVFSVRDNGTPIWESTGGGGGAVDWSAVTNIATNAVISAAYTNAGAVASAKSYADATFANKITDYEDKNFVAVDCEGYIYASQYGQDSFLKVSGGTVGPLTTSSLTVNSGGSESKITIKGAADFVISNYGYFDDGLKSSRLVPDDSPVATSNMVNRMTERFFDSSNADYAITNIEITSPSVIDVDLHSGEIQEISDAPDHLNVTCIFTDNLRGFDAMIRTWAHHNTNAVTVNVSANNVIIDGEWPETIPAGTNLLTFTKIGYDATAHKHIMLIRNTEIK